LEELAVSRACDDRDDSRRRRRRVGHGREQPLFAFLRLFVHVRDLDASDRADARAERERPPRIVGVHVHLDGGRVSDDEQRVADLFELALERAAIEILALDQEHGAVAELRELPVDRVEPDPIGRRGRFGEWLAAHDRRDAANELQQACAAAEPPIGVASTAPSTSAAPRTICEKITPELPRAPISAPRATSRASDSRLAAEVASTASTTARTVIVRFVPVSPSGTG